MIMIIDQLRNITRFKVQMKLYSVSQSFVLHINRHFSVLGMLIAASFTASIAPCIKYSFDLGRVTNGGLHWNALRGVRRLSC